MQSSSFLFVLAACGSTGGGDRTDGDAQGDDLIACGSGTERVGDACVDIDECEDDNGGCGDPEVWRCENREAAPPTCTYDPAADLEVLTDGVAPLEYGGGLSSRMVVWGETAFPLAWTDAEAVVAAAARVGKGRVLHVGHEGQLSGGLATGGASTLIGNAIHWMTRDAPPVIGVSDGMDDMLSWLLEGGFDARVVSPAELDGVDVWVTSTHDEHDEDTDARIRAWLEAGGGVIAGGHAWWWAYSTGGDDPFHDHPGNQWLGAAGLTLSGSSAGTAAVPVADAPGPLLHAGTALDAAASHIAGRDLLDDIPAARAAGAAGFAASVLPVDSPWFIRARSIVDAVPAVVPAADAPVRPAEMPIEALVVRITSALASRLPANEVERHPAAADFPGEPAADAMRERIRATVRASYAGRDARYLYSGAGAAVWRSTGAWIPAGEPVSVTMPPAVSESGIDLFVGAHSDRLWHRDAWERMPEIARSWSIDSETTAVASAFGGPLYVRIPMGVDLGDIEIEIDAAVRMPRFVAGLHSDTGWPAGAAAPWAELETDGLILTVPSEDLRAVASPTELATFWQAVMDAQATLAAIDPVRVRPERIVTDRQISAGWMHSGYPIMAHNASSADLTDLGHLETNGDWGAFHELGHNHQWQDWLLPGTTESTCNLWSVYTMEEVVGIDRADGHPALGRDERAERVQAYIDGGRDFAADWSVWTALETWLQLQEAFGWEPMIAMQQRYLDDSPDEAPSTDQARIDRWAVRMSDETGRDLQDFLGAWGVPLSDDARAAMSMHEAWLDHPMP
ncbi:MAG: M60 family metallopeptidase [Myxococcota bacterium]|nr:M60 family metallopeptidase [Myxococcota bacterium]